MSEQLRVSAPDGLDVDTLDEALRGERTPLVDARMDARLMVYAGDGSMDVLQATVDSRLMKPVMELRIADSRDPITGAYFEVEDATLLVRSPSGTPMYRVAVVNNLITEAWTLDETGEVIEAAESLLGFVEENDEPSDTDWQVYADVQPPYGEVAPPLGHAPTVDS